MYNYLLHICKLICDITTVAQGFAVCTLMSISQSLVVCVCMCAVHAANVIEFSILFYVRWDWGIDTHMCTMNLVDVDCKM